MMISSEQAHLAALHLQTSDPFCDPAHRCDVPPELLAKVRLFLDDVPDYREDRVLIARARIEAGPPASEDIASMMIGRIVSDAIR